MRARRPSHCPYCTERVKDVRRADAHRPPDEKEHRPPRVAMEAEPDFPHQQQTFETISALEMQPCGHRFKEADMGHAIQGDITMTQLGDRVLNPAHRHKND